MRKKKKDELGEDEVEGLGCRKGKKIEKKEVDSLTHTQL